jgi:hypothetical protein
LRLGVSQPEAPSSWDDLLLLAGSLACQGLLDQLKLVEIRAEVPAWVRHAVLDIFEGVRSPAAVRIIHPGGGVIGVYPPVPQS